MKTQKAVKADVLNMPGLYMAPTNKKGSSTKMVMITVNMTYKFMFVMADNGAQGVNNLRLLVKNNCCGRAEWIKRDTFLRRLKYCETCRACGKPNSRRCREDYYTRQCGGYVEGWGQYLAGPFGRFTDSLGR
jgi:hypothetical protein